MIPDLKGRLPYEAAHEHGYAVCREMLKEPPPPIMLASVSLHNLKNCPRGCFNLQNNVGDRM